MPLSIKCDNFRVCHQHVAKAGLCDQCKRAAQELDKANEIYIDYHAENREAWTRKHNYPPERREEG
jgi:hypothetical protein